MDLSHIVLDNLIVYFHNFGTLCYRKYIFNLIQSYKISLHETLLSY
jgi:hypothetical protein